MTKPCQDNSSDPFLPPTQTAVRPKGDVLRFDPITGTFGVMDVNGIPRTLFKPLDGMDYWRNIINKPGITYIP